MKVKCACGKYFESSHNSKNCSPECYHKNSRPVGKAKVYKKKHKPNTKCPLCEQWHYKEDADERVKRNFCKKCLININEKEESVDGDEIYIVAPAYRKEVK